MATLLELAAEILSSHASSTPMTTEELIAELHRIHSTLQSLDTGVDVSQTEVEAPIFTGMQSIKRNEVICLICNKGGFKTLTRHLNSAHGIKPRDYRKQFNIPAKQSLSARDLTKARKLRAIERGLASNLAKARETRAANIAAKKQSPAKAAKATAAVRVTKKAIKSPKKK